MYISKDELMAIPAPERTKTWNPIPHGEVFNQVDSLFQEMGVEVLNSRIDVDKTGANAFVTHRLSVGASEERCLELGWRNSTAKKFSLGFTSGIACHCMFESGFQRFLGRVQKAYRLPGNRNGPGNGPFRNTDHHRARDQVSGLA